MESLTSEVEQRVEELRQLLQKASYAYYVLDNPIMEDTVYDQLYRELQQLEKDVAKAKRIASEWASKVHDLVEDRLPAGFEELPEISAATYAACQEWARANAQLKQAQQETAT